MLVLFLGEGWFGTHSNMLPAVANLGFARWPALATRLDRPYLMQYRSVSAAAAGGAAAFADVAASGRAHLGAAGEAERSVRGAALLGLDQFGRAVRSGRKGGGRWLGLSLRRGRNRS